MTTYRVRASRYTVGQFVIERRDGFAPFFDWNYVSGIKELSDANIRLAIEEDQSALSAKVKHKRTQPRQFHASRYWLNAPVVGEPRHHVYITEQVRKGSFKDLP